MAAVLAGGANAVLSHRSAAALWGLTAPPRHVEVLRPSSPNDSAPNYARLPAPFGKRLTIHRSRVFGPEEVTTLNAIPTTTVPRTFLDLASVWSTRKLDSAMAEADRLNLIEIKAMREVSRRGKGWKGIGNLRQVVEAWDPTSALTKSDLELIFLRICKEEKIPLPQVNVPLLGFEVDCFWPDRSLVVELDSRRFHSSPGAFDRDKEKTAALEDHGHQVLRLTHRMLTDDPEKAAKRVKLRLARGSGSNQA